MQNVNFKTSSTKCRELQNVEKHEMHENAKITNVENYKISRNAKT